MDHNTIHPLCVRFKFEAFVIDKTRFWLVVRRKRSILSTSTNALLDDRGFRLVHIVEMIEIEK